MSAVVKYQPDKMAPAEEHGHQAAGLNTLAPKTGRKAFTRTKRELSRQIGASQAVIVKYGKLNAVAASNGQLEYLIIARRAPVCGPIPGEMGKLISSRLSSSNTSRKR